MYDARQIANWFVQKAKERGQTLSIMQLLKLVYIAHGWHLEITGAPLFPNKIEAWRHGPVIPDVYKTFRPQGVFITSNTTDYPMPLPPHVQQFLEEIWGIYGHMDPFHLSDITHVKDGPWDHATKRYGWFAPILNDDIKGHYQALRKLGNSAGSAATMN